MPEDPSASGGRHIQLNVAVVKAARRHPKPDPVFLLAGGPGQAATEIYPALSSTLSGIHQDRDIVLVDQRGTGKSNPLRCLDPKDETLREVQVIGQLKECPERLDADLRFYTTDIAMQDLDQVRAALGYEILNLYGISYGTRAALVYLKMYPDRVRSMILDAVVDPSFVLYRDAAQDGQRSLDLVFERCKADLACDSTYPHLRSEFEGVLQKLQKTPTGITIAHPITGRRFDVPLTDAAIASHVFNILYSPDLVAVLPYVIHQAYETENYAPLLTQGYLANTGIYDGSFYTVACAEDASMIVENRAAEGIFGRNVKNFLEICKAWPHQEPPEIVHDPIVSNVPVLMLSGEADPITPPWHAEALRRTLTNSIDVVFPGMGHGNSTSDCARQIMEDFIASASVSRLDTTCSRNVSPPPFLLNFSDP